MLKRYDKKKLKRNIIKKILISIPIICTSIAFFILIENNVEYDNIYIQIFSVVLFFIGLVPITLIGKDLRRLDIEDRNKKIEKYISELNDNNILKLCEMYLYDDLEKYFDKLNMKLYTCFPIEWDDAFQMEFEHNNKKVILLFHIDLISFAILDINEYDFNEESKDWNNLPYVSFDNKEQLLDYIVKAYNKIIKDIST